MNETELVAFLVRHVSSMSTLKVCLVLAQETEGGSQMVRLTLADFSELTGMAKQTIRDGLDVAIRCGWVKREASGNSYWYGFCPEKLTETATESSPKRHENKPETARDSVQTGYGIQPETARDSVHEGYGIQPDSSRNLAQSEKSIHIPDFKDRTYARAKNSEKVQNAYNEVAYATSHGVAEWLRDKRNFDFARALEIWGDKLEDLWKAAIRFPARKPGDKAKFRFQDACEGDLDLGVASENAEEQKGSARPKISYGDIVYHPEQGEFEAYMQALYEDSWRCPEGHFIPATELQVVRSAHA